MVKRVAALVAVAGALWALWLLFGPSAPAAAHPPLPPRPDAAAQCATCHGTNAKPPTEALRGPLPPADHAAYAPDTCVACHATVTAPSPLAASYASCATCHAGNGQEAKLPSGETLVAAVDIPRYLASVHGSFSCTECHPKQATIPHAPLTADSRREFTQEMAQQVCQRCHEPATASYEESFHGRAASLGVIRAATCTDCHTPHAVQAPARWSLADRAASCSTCHTGADGSFASGWMGHKEPSPAWFPIVFYAGKGFVTLTAVVLGLGIVHVELDVLRWGWNKARRRKDEEEEL